MGALQRRRYAARVAAVGVAGLLAAAGGGRAADETAGAYEAFNRFCATHFSARTTQQISRRFGADLKILDDGAWRHVSAASACIAWRTNLPAKSIVEYGTDEAYGKATAEPERHFFSHLHYLKDLRPGTTYHYRVVCTDERGRRAVGPDRTLATKPIPGAVRIPDDLPGPPYTLDRPNTTYLLTRDVTADATAVNIAADGITLDLGGHTLTYDGKAGVADPSANERVYGWHSCQGPCGIRTADGRSRLRILNGTVRQGAGRGASRPAAYNPLFLRRPRETEVAGLTVVYSGSQVTGVMVNNAYGGVEVHHNVAVDEGTELSNRHSGLDAIAFGIGKVATVSRCHHNLVKRTRHRGLRVVSNCDVYANEIYVDSYATNAYGIMYYDNRGTSENLSLRDNLIFGTGFHPIGIGSGQGFAGVKVRGNYIQMQGTEQAWRWRGGQGGGDPGAAEGAAIYPVNGIRLQRPRRDVEHVDNVVVVRGRGKTCIMRGLWIVPDETTGPNIVFRGNTVELIAEDAQATGYALSCGGVRECASQVTLADNTVVSNLTNVQFGDNYSTGGKYRFLANTFVRAEADPRYRTFRLGWNGWKYETYGHVFVESTFAGGAGYDSVSFDGAGRARYDFAVGWVLTLTTAPGAKVTVTDKTGAEAYAGTAAEGKAAIALAEYVRSRDGKAPRTPHAVTVEVGTRRTTRTVTMDRSQELVVRP